MKKGLPLLLVFIFPFLLNGQFEQKVSINLAAGTFKTIGKKVGKYDPMQMPNYKTGMTSNAGLQFNLNRRFSLLIDLGILYSPGWSYSTGSNDDYLHYTVFDAGGTTFLGEGMNYLNLFSFDFGVTPKYYILPDKKWNPYCFAGINFNLTSAKYTNNQWQAASDLGVLPADDTGPYDPFLEKNKGLGFSAGGGIEYSANDKVGFYLSTGYSLILLNKKNFKSESLRENLNALFIQAGVKFSFLKSKDL
jgi:opacity protein-like surface antigen